MVGKAHSVDADICIVGAGMVGLAHALEARRRGLSVVVLDRDERSVGASVRNFGHLFFTAVADGIPFECAQRSRERWLEFGRRAGLYMEQAGTVIVARADDEIAVLERVAGDPLRAARMLTAAEVGELLPIPTEELVGGFHSTRDLRVDPRAAVAALARLLEDDPEATVAWSRNVHEVEPGVVHASGLTVKAPLIVVCPGPDYRSLPESLKPGLEPLTRCCLQMLRVGAPNGRRYGPAIATALSLVRYPAFAARPEAAVLRARLQEEKPELLESGVHLLVTQLPDGDLTIGDTHAYGDTLEPFGEERLYELLLSQAARLLGSQLEVKQRWHGIYPSIPVAGSGPFHVTVPLPGVRVVQNVAGLGMTLSFGHAPMVLDELLGEPAVAAA